jgi:hypothetical protein
MASGGYIICEWNGLQKTYPHWQEAFMKLESEILRKCDAEWAPKTFGQLSPNSGEYGRTTIIPALFDDNTGTQMATWRQTFTSKTGHQEIITGTRTGNTLPEDFKVAWLGIGLPNKQQHLTEIKWQKGDRKYGRINLEEIHCYETPAIIFEEGVIIDEEEHIDIYGYIEPGIGDLLPDNGPGGVADTLYQSIVLLGAAYYKQIDRVLGNCGAVI